MAYIGKAHAEERIWLKMEASKKYRISLMEAFGGHSPQKNSKKKIVEFIGFLKTITNRSNSMVKVRL